MYETIFREADLGTVDVPAILTEQGADSPGNFDIPGAVTYLTGIRIAVAGDFTADAMYGFNSGMQLTGDLVGGHLAFPGPCGFTAGAAATSAGGATGRPEYFRTKIPVTSGGTIECRGVFGGEACGTVRMNVGLEFDGTPGKIKDYDYREENLAAANTPVALQTRQGTNIADFRPTGTIGEVRVNGGVKYVAGPLAATTVYRLSGAGIFGGAVKEFIGHSYMSQDDIAISGKSGVTNGIVYDTGPGIVVSIGNTINCMAMEVEDDVGTIFAVIGLGYV